MEQDLDSYSACPDLQLEEYQVLKAIYPDFISNTSDSLTESENTIRLQVSVELPDQTLVQIATSTTDGPIVSLVLEYLPPILIDVFLPTRYPLQEPPQILFLCAGLSWLAYEDALKSALLESWQIGETTLYSWIEFVRSGQFLRDLGYAGSSSNLNEIKLFHDHPGHLLNALSEYNAKEKHNNFLQGSFTCAICLEIHKGTQCIRLSCSHTFCKPCLEEFWTTAVHDCALNRLICADPGCMKANKMATKAEIQEILPTTVFIRWKWLKEKRDFEKDLDHAYCPACENPAVPPDDAGNEEDGWSRLRLCSTCRLPFCRVCKCAWHGPHFDCPIPLQILTRYITATTGKTDITWTQSLERTYTIGVLQRHVTRFQKEAENEVRRAYLLELDIMRREAREAEAARHKGLELLLIGPGSRRVKSSEEYLSKFTQSCPKCGAYIQRTAGCDHMVCSICGENFCYRCGQSIDKSCEC